VINRPCGACQELVPADTGCMHWKPGTRAPVRLTRAEKAHRAALRAGKTAPTVADFKRETDGTG